MVDYVVVVGLAEYLIFKNFSSGDLNKITIVGTHGGGKTEKSVTFFEKNNNT